MLVVKHHEKDFWVLFGCMPCDDETPRALYCEGFGSVMPTGSDEIKIFASSSLSQSERMKLYNETMEYYGKRVNESGVREEKSNVVSTVPTKTCEVLSINPARQPLGTRETKRAKGRR